MRKQSILLFLLLMPLLVFAQDITVPKNVYFADIHLKLSDGAQQEIQKKVDALHRNQTYFKMKVELADAYFPIIERVFKEEGVPDDFKYLALQESGLVGDAVSTSNAVGYWQFKKEAAADFNLRMDNVVDERSHIIAASRGAARYFKRSNNYYNNWFNALLSYYLGYTGAKDYTSPLDKGAKNMNITEKSHPYVLTFLAHKIAYDNFVGKNTPAVSLRELRATPGQSLADIALATKTDYPELERYNKWLLGNTIPSDKDYYVMVPVRNGGSEGDLFASNNSKTPVRRTGPVMAASMVKRNGLNALVARAGDTKDKLALQAGLSTRRFLKYNDMRSFDSIEEGAIYYTEPKKTDAETEYHVVQPGESMQQIAQHYGIKLNYLLFKNRMSRSEAPVPGRVLWLQKRRPYATPVEVRDLNRQQVASTAAPDSYNKPVATRTTEATKTTAAVHDKKPKENIFTRFINRLTGRTKQPEKEPEVIAAEPEIVKQPVATDPTPAMATEIPAEETAAAQQAPAVPGKVTQAETEGQIKAQPETEKEETLETAAPVTTSPAAKTNKAGLYPGTAKATPDTTTQQEAAGWPVQTSETEAAITAEAIEPAQETDGAIPAETIMAAEDTIFKETPAAAATTVKPAPTKPLAEPTTQPAPTRHVVQQGQTLYSISRMYAVSINDISRWNNLGEEPLKVGQELLIAEPLAVPAQSGPAETYAAPEAANGLHTVAAGETLYQISKMYNVTPEQLRTWNNLPDNSIRLGQELRVAAPIETATPAQTEEKTPASTFKGSSTYHTVAPGESMYQISRSYGVTIKDIMEWNNKSDFAVSAGEKLLIKKK
ncbi:LysM peptidoglycan-binding domain-containing protein [Pontibacter sp. 172403-2]|uniref:LysM peptidoglycan-binding domain-containing protein n=1 Tax=Pontibacter rufus TaxID=2791028 RepID=UPI0018AF5A25|nr:LysM peptidoglycan-binding domain-containing protein [Pontibacter sp. 172403-2]MBF9253416.1 LysM peptidoglycan-binding domain-containing protein [Pontibacter sp. 172403-2]